MGEGRPLLLIHGYVSNAFVNWIRYGHARHIADAGFRVIMPDLRGHGDSDKPHDPACYKPDVLADDAFDLVRHLGLTDYDLAGYSLGARTSVRMMAKGAKPRRAVLSGMGLDGILNTQGRGGYFRHVLTNIGSFERGSSEWLTEAFLKTTDGDPEALLLILDTFVDTSREELAAIDLPVLVVTGDDDDDNGSGEALAEALPHGRFERIPGNHMSAVTKPELGRAIASFLAS
ncbi:alpha/beta hydrolase [Sphingosinicella humi]|uniref:Alpha/beta hydrolase n=2 Tax=Allosphingosinicella humi TaxID=2068657 RepID=A0A2U2J6N0_9SPHN|nr:alpha/beta fold hydrolase [Sphingosinicella humi]PWG04003.1 alpha/beta hydrolase [Sphingosinicella humi]